MNDYGLKDAVFCYKEDGMFLFSYSSLSDESEMKCFFLRPSLSRLLSRSSPLL